MQSLDQLINKNGEPNILIDSFNEKYKRYAIWDYSECIYLDRTGFYLNGNIIKGNFENLFREILAKWKEDQKNQQIAAVGFMSYEFKDYIYTHIDFDKKKHNNFPLLWFCKPKKIIEYCIDNSKISDSKSMLGVVNDILPLNEYKSKIDKIKSYLKNGDVYQINFTDKKILNSTQNSSFKLYSILRTLAQPQEGIFIKNKDFDILSLSPESFVKVKNRKIQTSPIKGTRPFSKNLSENKKLKFQLQNSEKDKAEHLMIVDLIRNDLGKICQYGSIKVNDLFHVKSFNTVHHMVSDINGTLKDNINETNIFEALFPGGSITGAPKQRAIKIIDQIENYSRGIYTGAMGIISNNGDMIFNIAIRTLTLENQKAEYPVGGGVVWDSTAKGEREEAIQKSKILDK